MPLGTVVGLGPGNSVLDRIQLHQKKGTAPPPPLFGYVCCGQVIGWIKIPLGTEVDLGRIVLDGAEHPQPEMGTAAPSFWPTSIVAKQSPIVATAKLL